MYERPVGAQGVFPGKWPINGPDCRNSKSFSIVAINYQTCFN